MKTKCLETFKHPFHAYMVLYAYVFHYFFSASRLLSVPTPGQRAYADIYRQTVGSHMHPKQSVQYS